MAGYGPLAQALLADQARQQGVLSMPPAQGGILQSALAGLPMDGRATFLPFQDSLPGSVMNERQWALPGILASAINALSAPGRAFTGQLDPNSQQALGEAMNVAGMALGGGMASGVAPKGEGILGVNVFHGSPHKFDAFDASKIGTGEGAQAYGHGLYLAENPGVANAYAEVLGGHARKYLLNGKEIDVSKLSNVDQIALNIASRPELYSLKALEDSGASAQAISQIRDALTKFSGAKFQEKPLGNLYKVDLPDEMAAKMLDWDKPLSQQPESVQKALDASGLRFPPNATGQQIHDAFAARAVSDLDPSMRGALGANKVDASELLKKAGIPGIRYLDQGSRTAGQGTYNYVVFPGEEKALKILGRE